MTTLNDRARTLRALHERPVLVLPNAWDAASAALVRAVGARAVATSSSAISWANGRPDGEHLTRAEMVAAVGRIVAAVDLPVTADVEGGYGPAPADVARTVQAVLDAGAVGINLEDSHPGDGSLYTVDEQVARVRAAHDTAAALGCPDFVVNARTDVILNAIGEPAGRLDEVRRRCHAYATAGAGCLFIPGLVDLDPLRALLAELPLPVNVLARPGGPTIAQFAAAGVCRVSVGGRLAGVAYGAVRRAAEELLGAGTYGGLAGALDHDELDGLF